MTVSLAAAINSPTNRIPGRVRPFAKTQAPTPALMRLLLGRPLAPTRREYDRAVAALWDGDKPMDDWVDWMFEHGPRQGRQLFDQALEQGIDNLPNPPEPLTALFEQVDNPPEWVDFNLINEGARFIHGTGLTAPYVLRDLALMGGYMLSGFNQALVMTGALSKGASQRIAETGKWWIDCTKPDGLKRYGPGFLSTMRVRLVHSLVRRNLSNREDWDSNQWGLPLSQIDMAATCLGFSVVMLGGLRKMGVLVTPRESRAVMMLWRWACWLMGVEDQWLVDNERAGIVLLNCTMMTQSRPDWTSRELAQALAEEPRDRQFDRFQSLQRTLAYHRHLSVTRYFLGRDKMAELGLPTRATSWYPLTSLPLRSLTYSGQRFVPGLHKRQQQRGRQAQLAALATMFGNREQGIIKPDRDHPGHL